MCEILEVSNCIRDTSPDHPDPLAGSWPAPQRTEESTAPKKELGGDADHFPDSPGPQSSAGCLEEGL